MLVSAYDPETGKKLDYLVPEAHIDHPILGSRLSRLPSAKKASRKKAAAADPVTTTETPALGDNREEGVTPNA